MNEPQSLQQCNRNIKGHGLGITFSRSQSPLRGPRPVLAQPPNRDTLDVSMRSQTGMMGLADAETGANFLRFTPAAGGGSRFRSGSTIAPTNAGRARVGISESVSLDRQPTLFTRDATRERKVAELKNVLGKESSGRLHSKAKVLPSHVANGQKRKRSASAPASPIISLEQAKSRSRVELDLVLDSGTCVEGGYIKGNLVFKLRSSLKKEAPAYFGSGKIRVIGFEAIPQNDERHIFYHCGAPLERVSPFCHVLYSSKPDEEGFCRGNEGEHTIPFAMRLPPRQTNLSVAKGVYNSRTNGSSIRYIAMASIKIKDSRTNTTSIAHVYRSIEVWPHFDPAVALAPTPSFLYATTAKSIFLGGSGKLNLTASLHRATWVAGQRCYVKIFVANDTEKRKVQTLTLDLIRSETIFKPNPDVAVISSSGTRIDNDMDACHTSTIKRIVARNVLEMGEKVTAKHATARGWWTGVESGSSLEFNHYILLPPSALTISRSRLIEVNYVLQVGVGTGPLASEVTVQLPIRIINYISLDPPPSLGPPDKLRNPAPISNPSAAQSESESLVGADTRPVSLNSDANIQAIHSFGFIEDNGTYRGDNGMPVMGRLVVRNKTTPEVASSMGVGRTYSGLVPPVHGELWITQDEGAIKEADPALEESNEGFVETECLAGHHSLRKSIATTTLHRRQALGKSGFGQWRGEGRPTTSGFFAIGQAIRQSPPSQRNGVEKGSYWSDEEASSVIESVELDEVEEYATLNDEERDGAVSESSITRNSNNTNHRFKTRNSPHATSRPNSMEESSSEGPDRATSQSVDVISDPIPSRMTSTQAHSASTLVEQTSDLAQRNVNAHIGNYPNHQAISTRRGCPRIFPQRPRPQPIFMAKGGSWTKTFPVEMNRPKGATLRESVNLSNTQTKGIVDLRTQLSSQQNFGTVVAKEAEPEKLGDPMLMDNWDREPNTATMDIPRTVSALLAKDLKTPRLTHSSVGIKQDDFNSQTLPSSLEAPVFARKISLDTPVSTRPTPTSTLPLGKAPFSIQSRIAMFEQRQNGDAPAPRVVRGGTASKAPHLPAGSELKFKGGRL